MPPEGPKPSRISQVGVGRIGRALGGPLAAGVLPRVLDGPPDDELVPRLERAGGTRVSAGPHWDRWGVTFADPDGCRLVLCTRAWSND